MGSFPFCNGCMGYQQWKVYEKSAFRQLSQTLHGIRGDRKRWHTSDCHSHLLWEYWLCRIGKGSHSFQHRQWPTLLGEDGNMEHRNRYESILQPIEHRCRILHFHHQQPPCTKATARRVWIEILLEQWWQAQQQGIQHQYGGTPHRQSELEVELWRLYRSLQKWGEIPRQWRHHQFHLWWRGTNHSRSTSRCILSLQD